MVKIIVFEDIYNYHGSLHTFASRIIGQDQSVVSVLILERVL